MSFLSKQKRGERRPWSLSNDGYCIKSARLFCSLLRRLSCFDKPAEQQQTQISSRKKLNATPEDMITNEESWMADAGKKGNVWMSHYLWGRGSIPATLV